MQTIFYYLIYLLLGAVLQTVQIEGATIDVSVTNIQSDNGMLYVALYASEEDFLSKRYKSAIVAVKDGLASISFEDIPKGTYAISLFHDENDNKKLDMNFMGIPKEKTACSNNATGFMGPPKWKKAKFDVSDAPVILEINM